MSWMKMVTSLEDLKVNKDQDTYAQPPPWNVGNPQATIYVKVQKDNHQLGIDHHSRMSQIL